MHTLVHFWNTLASWDILGPTRTEHVNQSHIFPILSLVLSDHQENEKQFKIIPLVVLRDAVVLSGEP